MQRSRFLRVMGSFAVAAAGFPLAGCGGGGGSVGPAPAPAPPSPAPAPAALTFAYVPNLGSGDISIYKVSDDGTLSDVRNVAAALGVASVVIHPSGLIAYVVNQDSSAITTYSVDPETGLLSATDHVAVVDGVGQLRVHPSGRFLHVLEHGTDSIVTFSVEGETLTRTSALSLAPAIVRGLGVAPTGEFVYVAFSGGVSSCSVDAAGGLRLHHTAATAVQTSGPLTVAPTGTALYVAQGADVASHSVSATGEIGGEVLVEGQGAGAIAFHPSGRFAYADVYVSGRPPMIKTYDVDENSKALRSRANGEIEVASDVIYLAMNPSGQFLYATDFAGGTVLAFEVASDNGALTLRPEPFATTGSAPASITLHTFSR